MPIPLMVIIPVGLPLLIFIFRTFDRLVKAEYEINRSAWEADGRPRGFFWNAPECTVFRSDWARNRLHFFWLFSTPSWATASSECQTWLIHYRISISVWIILIVAVFVTLTSN
jgi:hypothetical protein